MTNTINYYNENAKKYIESTVNVDFHDAQDRFLAFVKEGSHILDFGCGSGRDAKYFLDKGYKVSALDGTKEFCEYASNLTGLKVRQMLFNEFEDKDMYDAVWACASILHCPKDELKSVMKAIRESLHDGGVFYTSFKYSEFEGERNGRHFTDLTEDSFEKLMNEVGGFELIDQWISLDVRPGRGEEKWLNVILRKK